jgi:hypothetical protein
MQGNLIARKMVGPRVGYRCVYRDEHPDDTGHPRSLFVAEDRVLHVLDSWLTSLTARNAAEVIAEMLKQSADDDHEPAEVARARKTGEEAQTKLERYLPSRKAWTRPSMWSGPGPPRPSWRAQEVSLKHTGVPPPAG